MSGLVPSARAMVMTMRSSAAPLVIEVAKVIGLAVGSVIEVALVEVVVERL